MTFTIRLLYCASVPQFHTQKYDIKIMLWVISEASCNYEVIRCQNSLIEGSSILNLFVYYCSGEMLTAFVAFNCCFSPKYKKLKLHHTKKSNVEL